MTRLMGSPGPALAQEDRLRATGPRRVLVFQAAGQDYALALEEVQEIVPLPLLTHCPGLPAVVEGFLDLDGEALPVVRLDRLFGLPEEPAGLYTPVLILSRSTCRMALLVQQVNAIVSLPAESLVPVPHGHAFNDCAEGVARIGERMVLLLSAERLLLEKEQCCLAELQDLVHKRLDDAEEAWP